jgi:antibiotic biosynthesis monooxygenase
VISRHWTGVAKPGRAHEYVDHLKAETFPAIAAIPGFRRASILSRSIEDGTEFQIVTLWDSIAAIRAFAGPTVDLAVVPPVVQALMVRYDDRVKHYDVTHELASRSDSP